MAAMHWSPTADSAPNFCHQYREPHPLLQFSMTPMLRRFLPIGHSHQSVAVASDGRTVLTVDYFSKTAVFDAPQWNGHLTFVNALDASVPVWDPVASVDVPTFRPVNVEIAPDGKTAIVAGVPADWKDQAGPAIPADMAFPVLKIASPGVVTINQILTSTATLKGSPGPLYSIGQEPRLM